MHLDQNKLLIRQTSLCALLDLSRSGLDKLRKKDQNFPKPLKDGASRQAASYYVAAEIEIWVAHRIAHRDMSVES
jgi:prophage regulatory protein